MSTPHERAQQASQRYQRRLEEIRKDSNLSAAGKRQAIEALYEPHRDQMRKLLEEHRGLLKERAKAAERKAFAPQPSQPEAFRSTLIALAGLDKAAMTRVMRLADLTGDELLAKAAVTVAADSEWGELVEGYVETHPEWGEAMSEAARASRETRSGKLRDSLSFSSSPPEELGSGAAFTGGVGDSPEAA